LLADVDREKKKIIARKILDNPHLELEKGKGIKTAKFLLDRNPDVVFSREDLSGKGPGYAFASAGVETRQTDSRDVEELLKSFVSGVSGSQSENTNSRSQ